jgi:hypothetical protein
LLTNGLGGENGDVQPAHSKVPRGSNDKRNLRGVFIGVIALLPRTTAV